MATESTGWHATLVVILLLILVTEACENCTDDSVTKHYLLEERSSRSNLAWLVTPGLFALGVIYVIYKCCRDGLCNCRRLRQRAALEHQQEHGYIPLNEVALYCTSHVPNTQSGIEGGSSGSRQLVLVHNQTFCVDLESLPRGGRCLHSRHAGPPTYEESVLHHNSRNAACPEVQVVTNPPSYISSKPPRYSVAMGEVSPRPSVSDDTDPDIGLASDNSRQLKFVANKRRHRSAQDSRTKHNRRRHFSAQDRHKPLLNEDDDEAIRQRCFSFNALKDAFKRSQNNLPECQSLLEQEWGPDTVFSSREAVSSSDQSGNPLVTGPVLVTTSVITTTSRVVRRPPQQVSFEDRILEDSESNESLEPNRSHCRQSADSHLRQRHFSAPDSAVSQPRKSRHSSGNT